MMPVNEVLDMLLEALKIMGIGVGGVFAILGMLYGALKLMKGITGGTDKNDTEASGGSLS